jgi:hypothetical protein
MLLIGTKDHRDFPNDFDARFQSDHGGRVQKGHTQEFKAAHQGFLYDLDCQVCLGLLATCMNETGLKMLGKNATPVTDEPPGDMCRPCIADVPAPAAEGRSIVAAGAATSGSDTVGKVLVELSIHGCS